jgi:hypothetical protein
MSGTQLIEEEQKMKVLKLENCALRAQIEVNDHQFAISRRVIHHLTHGGPLSAIAVQTPVSQFECLPNSTSRLGFPQNGPRFTYRRRAPADFFRLYR